MVVKGRKMECDFCKKSTKWIKEGQNPSVHHETDDWHHITVGYDISGDQQKNFCSSECVKLYLDRATPEEGKSHKSTESL